MPRIPTYDNFQTQISAAPRGQFQAPGGPNGAGLAAEQLSNTGQALSQAGAVAARVMVDELQQVNQVRVDDALNQLKERQLELTHGPEAGFLNLRGKAAMPAEGGKPLSDDYSQRLKDAMSSVMGELSNDAQRQMFQQHAAGMLTSFRGQLLTHEATEMRTYQASTSEAVISTAQRDMVLSRQNPDAVASAAQRIQAHTYRLAQLQGKSAEWADQQARKMESDGHALTLTAALDAGEGDYAQRYLGRFGERMDANDLMRAQLGLEHVQDTRAAQAVAAQVFEVARPALTPTPMAAMRAITRTIESNNRPGAIGPNVPGQGTAKGINQVMDATALQPGHGIRPAARLPDGRIDPKDRERVGDELLGALMTKYRGNPAQAWAAYNAGEKWVDGAIKAAAAEGSPGHWRQKLATDARSPANRKQTDDYISKGLALLARAQGDGYRTAPEPTIEQMQQQAAAALGPNARPAALQLARQLVEQRFSDHQKARNQQGDAATAEAMRELQRNGGRFDALPASTLQAVPPKEVDALASYAQRLRKGDDYTNPAVYQALSDPDYLATLSKDQIFAQRRELSEADFQHFARLHGELLRAKATGKSTLGNLPETAINSAFNDTLRTMRMSPTPPAGSAEAAHVGQMRQYVMQSVLEKQKRTGKMLDDGEVRTEIARIFAMQGQVQGWFSTTAKPAMTMKVGDIDSKTREKLMADFAKAGVTAPTPQQLLSAYWTAQSNASRRARSDTTGGW